MKRCGVVVMILFSGYLHAEGYKNNREGDIAKPSLVKEKRVEALEEHNSTKKPLSSCENLPVDGQNRCLKVRVKVLEREIATLKMVKQPTEKGIAPVVITPKNIRKIFKGAKLKITAKAPKKLPTYYVAALQSLDTLKAHLIVHGFTVLAVTPILEGKTVVTVTYDTLKKTNTLLATLQILVNVKGEIRVQNPSYFGAAYLQKHYRYGQFSDVLTALQRVLGEMYASEEAFNLNDLKKYQFMFGMPYLKDTITVAKGKNLRAKVTKESHKKYVAYTLKLPNGNIIVGHKLSNDTNRFLEKIGMERDANILPYESLIQGEKATILDPKYYLALSLPQLSMSDFMKIASAPGEIEKDIKRAYTVEKNSRKSHSVQRK